MTGPIPAAARGARPLRRQAPWPQSTSSVGGLQTQIQCPQRLAKAHLQSRCRAGHCLPASHSVSCSQSPVQASHVKGQHTRADAQSPPFWFPPPCAALTHGHAAAGAAAATQSARRRAFTRLPQRRRRLWLRGSARVEREHAAEAAGAGLLLQEKGAWHDLQGRRRENGRGRAAGVASRGWSGIWVEGGRVRVMAGSLSAGLYEHMGQCPGHAAARTSSTMSCHGSGDTAKAACMETHTADPAWHPPPSWHGKVGRPRRSPGRAVTPGAAC